MIKKFNRFFENADSKDQYLHYYAFDWDDNILNMPTVIHMDKLVGDEWIPTDVSTADFAEVRNDKENWRLSNNDPNEAFSEFRDFGPRGDVALLEDLKLAISKKSFGPAWNDFIECLKYGALFAIITARGHEAESMRKGVEWIIDNVLTEEELYEMYNNLRKFAYLYADEDTYDRILKGKPSENELVKNYLDGCEFVGVSAPSRGGSPANPEKAKEDALLAFKARVNKFAASIGKKAKIGFSDDDVKNVEHIEQLADRLNSEQFPHIQEFIVKGTKDPQNITKKIRRFESFSQTPGLESSIMPFASFNNLAIQSDKSDRFTSGGDETRQDSYNIQLKNKAKHLQKENYCDCCDSLESECVCGDNCKCSCRK